MIVDPNTGAPISQDSYGLDDAAGRIMRPGENRTAGAVGAAAAGMGIMSPDSFFMKVLDTVPSVSQGVAWNAYRGSRTIAYGARGVDATTAIGATFRPRYMRSMPSMRSLGGRSVEGANFAFSSKKYGPGQAYNPFNVLSRGGNYVFGKTAGKLGMGALEAEGKAFSPGALSRVSAMSKVSRGTMPTSNILNFIQSTDKELATAYKTTKARTFMGKGGGPMLSTPLTPGMFNPTAKEATHLLAMSAQGSITGRATGYMATMATGESAIARMTATATGNVAYKAGSQAAARHMSSIGIERVANASGKGFQFAVKSGGAIEKLGIKAGQKAGVKTVGQLAAKKGGTMLATKLGAALALNAVPVLGQVASAVLMAQLVVDVGKLGMEGVKSGIDFAKDAVKSYRGSIDKGVMGMGYRDNTVAATSRQRGVMAIQNSRLNARSVLGSEAGAMHAHFG